MGSDRFKGTWTEAGCLLPHIRLGTGGGAKGQGDTVQASGNLHTCYTYTFLVIPR